MTFKKYQSKPIERLAHRITEDDALCALPVPNTWQIGKGEQKVTFKAYESPQIGDYVVYLNDDDVYHCTAEVFRERNIVEDEPASN